MLGSGAWVMPACTIPLGSYEFSALLLGVKEYLPPFQHLFRSYNKKNSWSRLCPTKGRKTLYDGGLKKTHMINGRISSSLMLFSVPIPFVWGTQRILMFPVLGMGPARRLLWDSSQDEAWLLLSHGISAWLREGILHRWLLWEAGISPA